MKHKILLLFLSVALPTYIANAQNFNSEKNSWVNYIIRMYNHAPFEGVKVVDDNAGQYLICVLSLDTSKYSNESQYSRVASVKAQSMASRFFSGSTISSDVVIRTTENESQSSTELIETIKEQSVGYVKSLELISTFPNQAGRTIFIFSTPVNQQ